MSDQRKSEFRPRLPWPKFYLPVACALFVVVVALTVLVMPAIPTILAQFGGF